MIKDVHAKDNQQLSGDRRQVEKSLENRRLGNKRSLLRARRERSQLKN